MIVALTILQHDLRGSVDYGHSLRSQHSEDECPGVAPLCQLHMDAVWTDVCTGSAVAAQLMQTP